MRRSVCVVKICDIFYTGITTFCAAIAIAEMSPPQSDADRRKQAVAFEAGREQLRSGQSIGVGSGSTAKFLVDYIAGEVRNGRLTDVRFVPTSFQTRHWLLSAGLPVTNLEEQPHLDVCIDGADEVDARFFCIKGGGGCLTQEKIVQSCADRFIVIADESKHTDHLGKKHSFVPIEVVPIAYKPVMQWIEKTLGGKCELRMSKTKCGAVITDNNNYILDWHFDSSTAAAQDWRAANSTIACRPGVVETGLFLGVVDTVYLGAADGVVHKLTEPKNA